MIQEIKRVDLQAFIWLRCLEPLIQQLDIRKFGWTVSDENAVKPVWFEGHQFPPSLRRHTYERKGRQHKTLSNAPDADKESSVDECQRQIKKKRKRNSVKIVESPSDGDNELIGNMNSGEEFAETEDVSLENYSSEFGSDFSKFDSSDTSDSDYIVKFYIIHILFGCFCHI